MDAASEEECAVFLGEFLRPGGNLRLEVEGVLHTAGQLAQFFDIGVRLFFGYQAALFAQGNRQAEEDDQLRGERFGRGDTDFCAGAGVQYQFAFARQGRFHDVADGKTVFVP